jgi:hypothetical protein
MPWQCAVIAEMAATRGVGARSNKGERLSKMANSQEPSSAKLAMQERKEAGKEEKVKMQERGK